MAGKRIFNGLPENGSILKLDEKKHYSSYPSGLTFWKQFANKEQSSPFVLYFLWAFEYAEFPFLAVLCIWAFVNNIGQCVGLQGL